MRSTREVGGMFLAALMTFTSVQGCVGQTGVPAELQAQQLIAGRSFAPERSLAHGVLTGVLACEQFTALGLECDLAFAERKSETESQVLIFDGEECGRESNVCRSGRAVGTRIAVTSLKGRNAPDGKRAAFSSIVYQTSVVRGRRVEQPVARASVSVAQDGTTLSSVQGSNGQSVTKEGNPLSDVSSICHLIASIGMAGAMLALGIEESELLAGGAAGALALLLILLVEWAYFTLICHAIDDIATEPPHDPGPSDPVQPVTPVFPTFPGLETPDGEVCPPGMVPTTIFYTYECGSHSESADGGETEDGTPILEITSVTDYCVGTTTVCQ